MEWNGTSFTSNDGRPHSAQDPSLEGVSQQASAQDPQALLSDFSWLPAPYELDSQNCNGSWDSGTGIDQQFADLYHLDQFQDLTVSNPLCVVEQGHGSTDARSQMLAESNLAILDEISFDSFNAVSSPQPFTFTTEYIPTNVVQPIQQRGQDSEYQDFDLTTFDMNEWLLPPDLVGPVETIHHAVQYPGSGHEESSPGPSRPKRKRPTIPSGSVMENPQCVSCSKRFRPTLRSDRCNRCAAKHERATAHPPLYTLSKTITSVAAARALIYPHAIRRGPREGDDVPSMQALTWMTDRYIAQLLAAVNTVVDTPDAHGWAMRQQHVLNGKAKMESTYSNAHVTARVRALFHELLLFHTGGHSSGPPSPSSPSDLDARHFYSIGGDNAGYPLASTQTFSVRFANICHVLRVNKRVAMDVIEGRGVQGFVGNPWVYHRRKASNNDCNVKKKVIMEKGKMEEEAGGRDGNAAEGAVGDEGEVVSSSAKRLLKRGRKGKGKRASAADSEDEDEDAEWRPDEADLEGDVVYGSGRQRLLQSVYGGRKRR